MFNIPPPIEFDWQLHPIFKLLLYSMNISNDTEIIRGYKIEIIFVINISFFLHTRNANKTERRRWKPTKKYININCLKLNHCMSSAEYIYIYITYTGKYNIKLIFFVSS